MKTEEKYDGIDDLIIGYFTREISSKDTGDLFSWVNLSPENEKYFLDLQEIWFSSLNPQTLRQYEGSDAYMRFRKRIERNRREGIDMKLKNKLLKRVFYYAAAVIALLLAVSYLSYERGSKQVTSQFTDVVIEVPGGSRTKMHLPDGSLVWLNCGSKIVYSQGFGVNDRKVFLSGEAYFEVVKNEKVPFVVRTEELKVDVLGTKFNFRNYPDDEEATVSLLEGKVMVGDRIKKDRYIHLSPNQKVFFNKQKGEMRVIGISSSYIGEWVNGDLFFDEELLSDIVKKLERSYDVNIILADRSLETFRFYGTFVVKDNSIEDVLSTLSKTNKIKYKIEGKKITLSAN